MGLFDSIASQAAGALLGQPGSAEAGTAPAGMMDVVLGLLGSSGAAAGGSAGGLAGGLAGLVSAFGQQGLGHLVESWIGTGHNLPVAPDQLMSVLGNEQVQGIARQLGLPVDGALQALAQVLPQAVDGLTPGGQLPEAGSDLLSQGLSLLQGLGGRG
ncbi:MAG: hypothetical protein RIQ60_996 [Pseudomonadota bacterium]|jgi:uncharacterized protein YidB (DUF937 family)